MHASVPVRQRVSLPSFSLSTSPSLSRPLSLDLSLSTSLPPHHPPPPPLRFPPTNTANLVVALLEKLVDVGLARLPGAQAARAVMHLPCWRDGEEGKEEAGETVMRGWGYMGGRAGFVLMLRNS